MLKEYTMRAISRKHLCGCSCRDGECAGRKRRIYFHFASWCRWRLFNIRGAVINFNDKRSRKSLGICRSCIVRCSINEHADLED